VVKVIPFDLHKTARTEITDPRDVEGNHRHTLFSNPQSAAVVLFVAVSSIVSPDAGSVFSDGDFSYKLLISMVAGGGFEPPTFGL
jgi:hypothetical protein